MRDSKFQRCPDEEARLDSKIKSVGRAEVLGKSKARDASGEAEFSADIPFSRQVTPALEQCAPNAARLAEDKLSWLVRGRHAECIEPQFLCCTDTEVV